MPHSHTERLPGDVPIPELQDHRPQYPKPDTREVAAYQSTVHRLENNSQTSAWLTYWQEHCPQIICLISRKGWDIWQLTAWYNECHQDMSAFTDRLRRYDTDAPVR